MLTGILSPGLGILGVHNEQKCIIWMFQKKGMIRYHLFTYVEMKGKIGRRGNSKSLFLSSASNYPHSSVILRKITASNGIRKSRTLYGNQGICTRARAHTHTHTHTGLHVTYLSLTLYQVESKGSLN